MSNSYVPPSAAGQSSGGANNNAFNVSTAFENTSKPVHYQCGDCDAEVVLQRGDAIRCKVCGHRVLYKQRTNRMVQFEAR